MRSLKFTMAIKPPIGPAVHHRNHITSRQKVTKVQHENHASDWFNHDITKVHNKISQEVCHNQEYAVAIQSMNVNNQRFVSNHSNKKEILHTYNRSPVKMKMHQHKN